MPRNISAFLLTACTMLAPIGAQAAGGKAHWGYSGHEGPEHWAELAPGNKACAGTSQSPIDIISAAAVAAGGSTPEMEWHGFAPAVVNNGHTIQVNTGGHGGSVVAGSRRYELLQFHFHHLSEHTIDGKHAPLEVHFVHKSDYGDLFVIGVMIEEGDANPVLEAVFDHIPEAGHTHESTHEVDPTDLMPGDHAAFRYRGSLTTPPCSEIVTWHVMEHPITASKQQIEAFSSLYSDNFRPVEPANHRMVVISH